jgi:hypothetical protein
MTLRKRFTMLRGVYAEQMPYRDPHTAAPALWALKHSSECEFEVSVAAFEGTTPQRKGVEALLIALYRQERGCSPTVNFGRIAAGYRMSSGNTARLAAQGKLFRGGPWGERTENHEAGIAPVGTLQGSVVDRVWCGHRWSEWVPVDHVAILLPSDALGLYRLRDGDAARLLYIGQGALRARLKAHRRRSRLVEHPQGAVFAAASALLCSWVINGAWKEHQRLEVETDLIGAHVLTVGEVPSGQFLG